MEIIGVIMEGNPFHNGHKYFIEEIKKMYPDSLLICVMTSSFTMRGEISIIDKFTKIKAFLNHHIDLVFELPFNQGVQSSDFFALYSVKILNALGVKHIICGTELEDLNLLDTLYTLKQTKEFNETLNKYLKTNSYKVSFTNTLKDLKVYPILQKQSTLPNFTLSFAYYQAIKDHNYNINLHLIKRTNSFYELTPSSNITSATTIRNMLENNIDVSKYVPQNYDYINILDSYETLYKLLKYQMLISNISIHQDKEGFNNYLKNNLTKPSFDEYLTSSANKKYSKSKIRRGILHHLLSDQLILDILYLRLLGTNQLGITYLNSLEKDIKKQIFSSPKEKINEDIKQCLDIELKATSLYQNITNKNIILEEYRLPIRKKD